MNRIVGKSDTGEDFLVLVLEPGNIHRIKSGDPIYIKLDEHFPDGVPRNTALYIHYSETPIGDAKEMAKHTKLVIDERSSKQKILRPHCAECKSTVEQIGIYSGEASAISLLFCATCGCIYGAMPAAFVGDLTKHKM